MEMAMTDSSPPDDDKLPDAEAEERFKRTLGNLVNTPHKPHAPEKHALDKAAPVSSPGDVSDSGKVAP